MRITYEEQGHIFNIEVKPEGPIPQYRPGVSSTEQSYTIEIVSYNKDSSEDTLTHEFQGFILIDPIEEDVEELFFDDWLHKILFHWELKNSTKQTPPWAKNK